MINKQILILIILSSLCFMGCNNRNSKSNVDSKETYSPYVSPEEATQAILYIHEKTIPCSGGEIQHRQCFQTRENPSEEWSISYDIIEDFDYEEGYRYKIKVNILTLKDNEPIVDAPDRIYTLIEILEKSLIENGVEYEL